MVVRLKDLRDQTSQKEETKKTGVVRLADVRKQAQIKQVESYKAADVKFNHMMVDPSRPFVAPYSSSVSLDPSQSPVMQDVKKINAANDKKKAEAKAEAAKNTNYEKRKDLPSRKIPVVGSVLKTLDKLSDTKVQHVIADIGQTLYTPGGSAANVAGLAEGIGSKVASLLPNAGKVAQKAITGAATGAPLGVGQYQAMGGDDTKEALKQGVFGAALGGAGSLAGSALSKSFDAIFRKVKPSAAPVETGPILGLPEPKSSIMAREAQNRSVLPSNETPIYGRGDVETLGLPESPQYNAIQRIKAQQTLNLPEANPQTVADFNRRNGNVLPTNNSPIYGQGNVADPLGLPQGNYVKPTRLKVNDANQSLDYVMKKIKPEVIDIIQAPARRDLLINYVQKNTGIPIGEIYNMPMRDLQDLGQQIQDKLHGNMQQIAYDVAAKHGHDLPSLLEGQAPNLRQQIARDAQSRVYGVPAEKVNIAKPQFNKEVTGQAAAPKQGLAFKREPKLSDAKVSNETPQQMQQRYERQIKEANDRKQISELSKPIIGRVAMPETRVGRANIANREVAATTTLKPKVEPIRGTVTKNTTVNPKVQVVGKADTLKPRAPQISGRREFGTLTSLKNSDKTSPKLISEINKKGETTYDIKHNEETLANANKKLADEGHAGAKSYLMNKSEKEILSSDDVALGYRLIDELSSKGDHSGAADVSLKLMQSNLEGGRSVQINSIYNRLSKEGILRVATKQFNDGITKLSEQKALPAAVAEQIDVAATKLKGATGNVQVSKEAISILDKAKNGEKLTDAEVSKLRQFASEAKKYIPEKDPVTRKRDKVVEYTSRQADMARKRLAASRNVGFAAVNKGNPVIDHAIIGVDYMVKGAVKFSDYAEKMVKELGGIDNLDETFNESWKRYRRLNDIKMSEFEKMTDQAIINHSISPNKANVLRRMAIEFSQLEGKVQNEALGELQQTFNSFKEGAKGQKAAALLRTAQLGNVRTLLRNEIGNNLFYALDTLRRKFIATPIDLMTSWKGNRDVFFKSNPESWLQYFKDWKTGYKAGKLGVNPKGLETQYDLGSLAFNPDSKKLTTQVASFLERQVSAVMKAGDYASANRAIATETYRIAQKRAYGEGLRGKALRDKAESYYYTADEKMQEAALEYGKYMTFQDKNFLSDAAMKVKDTMNFGQDFGLGNVFFNYPKTPANIFMRAVDYSPMGFIKFMGQASGIVKDASKAQMVDTFSRAIAGTGMGAIGAYLAYIGLVNVLPSKNKDLNSLERNAGVIPNSVNLDGLYRFVTSFGDKEEAKPKKGDKYASVDWLQPMAITGSAGAALGQSQTGSRLDKTVNAAGATIQALGAATDSATNMSVYKNIKNLFGRDYESKSDYIGRLIASAATAGIPSIVGQVRNSMDPNTRETKNPDVFKQVGNVVANKIPSLSGKLPKKIDTLGKEVKSDYGVFGRIFNAFVNPSLMDTYNPSEGAKTVLDIVNRTGQIKAAPSTAAKSFQYKNEKYVFSPTEYQGFQEKLGMLVDEGIQKNLEYLKSNNHNDEQKVARLEKIMTESLETAKKGARKTMAPLVGK